MTDLRLTLSTQLMQTNPVTAGERLVAQTATDAATQAARVATFPIPRAVLLDLSRALGGGGMTKASTGLSVFGTPAAVGTAAAAFARGGGVVGTVESIVQDGVVLRRGWCRRASRPPRASSSQRSMSPSKQV